MAYHIGSKSSGDALNILQKMDTGQYWIFDNGTDASTTLGRFERYEKGGSVFVYTASEDAVSP